MTKTPAFPNFQPYDRVAVRMPMDKHSYEFYKGGLKAGDMLYVIRQDWLETEVEEVRTGIRGTVQTLDLEPWTR